MASVRLNIAANLAGRVAAALINFAAVPVFLRLLGVESFGLVALYTTFQTLALVLDLGLSLTINRELALAGHDPERLARARSLLRASEAAYWGISILAGIVLALLSPYLATGWIRAQGLGPDEARNAFIAMGLALAVQLPAALYVGGLSGLQQQFGLNLTQVGFALLRAGGAILILQHVAATPTAFLLWQALAALAQSLILGLLLRRSLPQGGGRGEGFVLLRDRWRFVVGANLLALLGALVLQADKLVLSRTLPLETFGIYSLAALAASLMSQLSGPIFTAYQPRLTQLVGHDDTAGLVQAYRVYAQAMAVVVMPTALVGALFAPELMSLWTLRNPAAAGAALPFAVLVIGWALNALATVPGTLQLAHGQPGFGVRMHAAAVLLLVPALAVLAERWGATAAAGAWVAVNLGYLLMHGFVGSPRYLPRGETLRWFAADVVLLSAIAGGVAGLGRLIVPHGLPPLLDIPVIGLCWLLATAAAAMAGERTRALVLQRLRRARA